MTFRNRVFMLVAVLAASTGAVVSAQRRQDSLNVPLYRFTVDYFNFGSGAAFRTKERFVSDYRKNRDGTVTWTNVSHALARELTGDFRAADPQTYMEGFTYRPEQGISLKPECFKGFPATATQAKNLVWDTVMFEYYAQQLPKLTQTPYHLPASDVPMAGIGTFSNRDVELTQIGIAQRDGQRLAILHYDAFFNTLDLDVGDGAKLMGRSDYWGDVWVVPTTKAVEHATLYEEVGGEVRLPSQPTPQQVNVVRRGSFDRVRK